MGGQSGSSSPTQTVGQGVGSGLQSFGQSVASSMVQNNIPSMPAQAGIAPPSSMGVSGIPQDEAYMQLILQSLQSLQQG